MDFPRLSPPHVYAGRWSAPGSPREFGGKSPPGAPKVRRERECSSRDPMSFCSDMRPPRHVGLAEARAPQSLTARSDRRAGRLCPPLSPVLCSGSNCAAYQINALNTR
ncbi:hypothetical protein NDU88_001693 [Pleurodeles waltl]|uniref:Uncharacterized protein n=1 Tax=Pleurodeles waltl TaxID=8319 RepID=A0AAV7S8Q3_PLEWA|nr:hypothetical protein NDU88_001693 [Pleurodeles waltl]